jgi:ribosome-binding protein aMBF1 (putative translation factor)
LDFTKLPNSAWFTPKNCHSSSHHQLWAAEAQPQETNLQGGVMAQHNGVDKLIARRIRLRRIQRGIETKSLAASVKIPEDRLQAFEAGRESIRAEVLAEIAGALDVSSAYFYSPLRTSSAPKHQTRVLAQEGAD